MARERVRQTLEQRRVLLMWARIWTWTWETGWTGHGTVPYLGLARDREKEKLLAYELVVRMVVRKEPYNGKQTNMNNIGQKHVRRTHGVIVDNGFV